MKSILDIEVSCFKNYNTPDIPEPVNLLSWLQSAKYMEKVERIRQIGDKKKRDELKATLPAITPSGLFSYRAKKDLIKHSGLIAIDIDFKGNNHLRNFNELKRHLCNIPNVAYCGLSVSGKGYWCLIPIAYPNKHELHFRELQKAFKTFEITIDESCKDVSRLRGYSYDPEGYFNHTAISFTEYEEAPKKKQIIKRSFSKVTHSRDKIPVAVNMIYDAMDGEKHSTLLKAANLMGGYIASGEVDENSAIDAMEAAILSRDIDNKEAAKKTIKSGIEYGKNSPISSIQKLSFDYRTFREQDQPEPQQQVFEQPQPQEIAPELELQTIPEKKIATSEETVFFSKAEMSNPKRWDQDIAELENFFHSTSLPTDPVKLNQWSTITDVRLFASSHLTIVKANNGNRTFLPQPIAANETQSDDFLKNTEKYRNGTT